MTDPTRAADKDLGRFYTPPAVARLALALAVGPLEAPAWRSARIWDPTCGDGGFLGQAALLGAPRPHLVGHDVDGAALGRLRSAVPGAAVQEADLFDLDAATVGTFDAIAGNPPYVRHERMDPARQRRIAAELGAFLGVAVPGGLDLSVLATLHALRFLTPGGRLAFVLPATWLDTGRAHPVRSALAARYRLRAVVESRTEVWFPHAAVNTVIAVFENGPPGPTVFAQVDRADPRDAAAILAGTLGRTVAPEALQEAPSWSPFLRAPDVWFDVLAAHPASFTVPRPVLTLRYGTKPGISAFFAPRDPQELDGVEASCLRPFLRTLRGIDTYIVRSEDVSGRLFVAPQGEPPAGAGAWIDRGAQRTTRAGLPLPQAPSVRANRPWWRLAAPRTGDVLVPQFRAARHHVIDNPDGVLVNNSAWWGAWVDPAHRGVGAALLNTSWMALAAEVRGRVNLGEGLLTLYGPELQRLPIPDPRRITPAAATAIASAWAPIAARRVLPFLDEVDQPDRARLDAAALAALGLDPALARPIRAAARDLLDARLTLARQRRTGPPP